MNMRKALIGGMLAVLVFGLGGSLSAATIIDFGTGDAGAAGLITALSPTTGTGSAIAIDALTVVNAGLASGTYDVDGAVVIAGEVGGVGSLDYNSLLNTFTVTGSIVCDAGTTGLCTGKPVGTVLVSNGVLLMGTGTVSLTNDTSIAGQDKVSFSPITDDKSAALLTALGIACNPDLLHPGFCSGWVSNGFTIGAQIDSTNTYTAFSTDVPDTSVVPEPASLALLGSGLIGLAGLLRRKLLLA